MNGNGDAALAKLAIPKGRMYDGVVQLLNEAGIQVRRSERGYRPRVSLPGFETKILKHQNIVEMLHHGSRDVGFAGADWVMELEADLIELMDTDLDPVRCVAAAPKDIVVDGQLPARRLVVASEYERMTRRWIAERGLDARFVRSYGATEVFPPEDADCIIDNTATGSTLRANGLMIVDELMRSSTRLYANPRAMDVPEKRELIEQLVLLLESVLEARRRVMVEVNVPADRLKEVVGFMPCMLEPTVAKLYGDAGYAVKVAVRVEELPALIPRLKAHGASDILVCKLNQIVP